MMKYVEHLDWQVKNIVTSKKVILFIVEGITDETSLARILKEIFEDKKIYFQVVNTDITSELTNNNMNIITKINNEIKKSISRNYFKKSDIIQIIHVVDLDGAKDGKCVNLEVIKKIKQATKMAIELGGGIRNMDTVDLYLEEIGIDRVILGTAAINDPDFLKMALKKYGSKKIVVGVDIKDGYVSTSGWLETSNVPYLDFIL